MVTGNCKFIIFHVWLIITDSVYAFPAPLLRPFYPDCPAVAFGAIDGYDYFMNQHRGKILIAIPPARLPQGSVDRVKALSGREVVVSTNAAEIEKMIDTVEIAAGDLPFDLLPGASGLAWVQLWSAGGDIIQKYPQLKTMPFTMTSTSGMHGPQMTEHLFGMLLSYARRFHLAFRAQPRHEWYRPKFEETIRLAGKSMLILGYGAIGRDVARAAKVFGMEVTGLRRNLPAGGMDGEGTAVKASSELMNLLPGADFVVNILPLTPETENSIGKSFFEAMKTSGVYINIGRGKSTDETALVGALNAKTIAGAILDVTREEPLPKDSPLWDMDNVLISGHYSGFTPDYDSQSMGIFLKNLEAYVKGEPLFNVIDKVKGY